jgi:hypothetical protein
MQLASRGVVGIASADNPEPCLVPAFDRQSELHSAVEQHPQPRLGKPGRAGKDGRMPRIEQVRGAKLRRPKPASDAVVLTESQRLELAISTEMTTQ